jgi:ribosomal protein S18 acetylase RimI-like enzyme
VIRVKGACAGYLVLTLGYSLEFQGRDGFIDELFLVESFRGRGVGDRVLELVENEARALGVVALHLEVERKNAAGQRFYRRNGYLDHDRYLMTKRLNRP